MNMFYAKLSKCQFRVPSIDYLGHIVSADGVCADLYKLHAIAIWPTPHFVTALRGFLGLTKFYHRFIRHYASIAAPLINLLKQKSFHWIPATDAAFLQLQSAMLALPVLWLTKLLGYDYVILYTPGKANVVADALSHHSATSLYLFIRLSTATPSIMDALRQFFSS
ncbi:UNVERIFIED_CONTAM: putative mitochondrial protein [Sesamum radiatum]|uniref:Mitochondrial protein n=1 Tax=Sesamum radiatum TaxID=300843 RepID=A0AAW2S5H3_SESRA